jgi:hypothetical protein
VPPRESLAPRLITFELAMCDLEGELVSPSPTRVTHCCAGCWGGFNTAGRFARSCCPTESSRLSSSQDLSQSSLRFRSSCKPEQFAHRGTP